MKVFQIILAVLISHFSFSQTPEEVWETISSMPGTNVVVVSTKSDASGNVYSTGYYTGTIDADFFVSKHDNNGTLVFIDTYDSNLGYDKGREVDFDNNGNTYVVGNIKSPGGYYGEAILSRKYDPVGNMVWSKTYSSAILTAHAWDMQVSKTAGELYVVGYSENQVTADGKNQLIIKYSTTGVQEWAVNFDGGDQTDDEAIKIKLDNSGNAYVAGEVNNALVSGTYLFSKYSTSGALNWSNTSPVITTLFNASLKNEGANIAIYDHVAKYRYNKTTGTLNETINFENAVQDFGGNDLFYTQLSDGRYIRIQESNSIKLYDALGNEQYSTGITSFKDIQIDQNYNLFFSNYSAGADSTEVYRKSFTGSGFSATDWNYRYQPQDHNSLFNLTPNNTFTISTQSNLGDSLLVHRACIPPSVTLTTTGLNWQNAVCPGDTVFYNIVSEYADGYSWFGNSFGNNTDSIYIWAGNGPLYSPLNLGITIDAGNGCTVDLNSAFTGYRTIDTYIIDNSVGNCENDQGYLQSLNVGTDFRFNWYFDGVQQTFNSTDYNFNLSQGNGLYELSIYDVVTGCSSNPTASVDVTSINTGSNANFTYNSNSYCPSSTDPVPTITGDLGGVFSSSPSGLILNAITGEISLLASIEQTTYSVSYITAGICPDTAIFNVTIEATEDASFSYSAIDFCENEPDEIPTVLEPGGLYTSTPPGLALNNITGDFQVAGSAIGNYVVIYQTMGTCNDSSSVDVNINAEDDASFTYGTNTYCTFTSDPVPIITGNGGGTFSATPVGLVMNPTTGEIDLSASTPNLYTVSYTTGGNCFGIQDFDVTIVAQDNPNFSYTSSMYCENNLNETPVVTGTPGGTFSSTPAGLLMNPVTGEISFSGSAIDTYLIQYLTPGTCPAISFTNVTIDTLDVATMNYSSPFYCEGSPNPSPSITGTTGGTFSATPLGLVINASTGEVDLTSSVPASYSIKYLTNGLCPDSSTTSFEIIAMDDASFSFLTNSYCQSNTNETAVITGTSGGTFISTPAGLSLNGSTGEINFSASTPNTYTVQYTTGGTCSAVSQVNLTINTQDVADVVYSSNSYCASDANTFPTILATMGGVFSSSPSGLVMNPTTGEIDFSSSTPNTYNVSYATNGPCSDAVMNVITINAVDDASFSFLANSYCQSNTNETAVITGTSGGTFMSTPTGLSLNSVTGEIDFSTSTPNTYTIQYTTGGTCSAVSQVNLTINTQDVADVVYSSSSYCASDANTFPTILATLGGIFSATPAGLVINPTTGEIDLSASTSNTYSIMYLTSGSCPDSMEQMITVNAIDDASFSFNSSTYCLSGSNPSPTISGLAGGVFSETGGLVIDQNTGEIDIVSSGIGSYSVTYLTNGQCPGSSTLNIEITNLLDATFTYNTTVFCQNYSTESPVFTSGANAGVFYSVPVGLTLNPTTGEIDPSTSIPNNYTVFNSIPASGVCNSSLDSILVEVLDNEDASFYYDQAIYYYSGLNPQPIVTGDMGGVFTEATGNVSINPVTGEIDILSSTIGGPYVIEYTTSGFCSSTETFNISIENDLSIAETHNSYISIFPNPTANIVTVEIENQKIEVIQLFDIKGELIIQVEGVNNISLSELSAATYILKIRTATDVYTSRVMKK